MVSRQDMWQDFMVSRQDMWQDFMVSRQDMWQTSWSAGRTCGRLHGQQTGHVAGFMVSRQDMRYKIQRKGSSQCLLGLVARECWLIGREEHRTPPVKPKEWILPVLVRVSVAAWRTDGGGSGPDSIPTIRSHDHVEVVAHHEQRAFSVTTPENRTVNPGEKETLNTQEA
jgi:hypothetical protein